MILDDHSDSGFNNEYKSRSRSGARIFLSKNDPFSSFNDPVLTIAQIIKFVMSSAAEAEISGLFITENEILLIHQTLIEMV